MLIARRILALGTLALVVQAWPWPALARPTTPRDVTALGSLSRSFEGIAAAVGPAVVQIYTVGYVPPGEATNSSQFARQENSGTGVILDPSGYIVTNAHVVSEAHRIQVVLAQQYGQDEPQPATLEGPGETIDATIVGVDLETDLALLKVDRSELPALRLADSDTVRPGQIVLAFGSPLGLANSVTMGVVSAAARQLEPDDQMIYIQTDATINPGNSGGPLVNAEGDVIGINTLIYSQSGGSEGIGFAAPANIVRSVYEQLRDHGRVRRGAIGVHAQTIDRTLARGLGLARGHGIVLGDVTPDGPAAAAGLQIGDVVVSLGGRAIDNGRQLDVHLYQRRVGDVVTLEVIRGAEVLKVPVAVVERPDPPDTLAALVNPVDSVIPALGILALELNDQIRALLPSLRQERGIVVAQRSTAAVFRAGGLQPGDVIYSINTKRVTTLDELSELLASKRPGSPLAIQLERDGSLMFLGFEMH